MATELFSAIKAGDKTAVDRLLERDRALVDARDDNGLSPILTALYHGKSDIATTILRRRPTLDLFEGLWPPFVLQAGEPSPLDRSVLDKHRSPPRLLDPRIAQRLAGIRHIDSQLGLGAKRVT